MHGPMRGSPFFPRSRFDILGLSGKLTYEDYHDAIVSYSYTGTIVAVEDRYHKSKLSDDSSEVPVPVPGSGPECR